MNINSNFSLDVPIGLANEMLDQYRTVIALILGYIVYRIILAPQRLPSNITYDRLSAKVKALRMKHFPPPYPNGWHRVCSTCDIEDGKVHSISALGKEMVAFRGADGKIGVLDAYCPHPGAHLGSGGKVVNGALVCPFHEWAFNPDGTACSVPYCRGDVPERAKTKAHHCREVLGMIFVWFHAEGLEPQWELEYHKDVANEEKFYYATMRKMKFDQHSLEMHMNSADYYHFQTLHRPIPLPILENVLFGRHYLKASYFEDALALGAKGTHVCFFSEEMIQVYLFGKIPLFPKWFLQNIVTKVTFEGPTIVHFSVGTIFGEMRMIKTILVTEPFKIQVEARWYAQRGVPRILVNMMAMVAGRALEQDREVWENKLYHEKPMLVSGDGPFPAFKRYYYQFYTESSSKVGTAGEFDW